MVASIWTALVYLVLEQLGVMLGDKLVELCLFCIRDSSLTQEDRRLRHDAHLGLGLGLGRQLGLGSAAVAQQAQHKHESQKPLHFCRRHGCIYRRRSQNAINANAL